MRIVSRADKLHALRELGTLAQAEPREGDEAVRDELTRRAGGYIQDDVDAWFAGALAPQVRPVTARGSGSGPPPTSQRPCSSSPVVGATSPSATFTLFTYGHRVHGEPAPGPVDVQLALHQTKAKTTGVRPSHPAIGSADHGRVVTYCS
ncbi:hypothetical protein [Streptomyces cyaneofuscatus]|uniref:hypothetical protein n=1 Tax=Streptomyces cyaneofuscatus TaxID=66883 RepID=UPI00379A4744